jgi:hypothetical protein
MFQQLFQVSPEAKERAAEAKSRGDDAFKRNEYLTAVNDYAQVCHFCILFQRFRVFILFLVLLLECSVLMHEISFFK